MSSSDSEVTMAQNRVHAAVEVEQLIDVFGMLTGETQLAGGAVATHAVASGTDPVRDILRFRGISFRRKAL
jgi:hypothetical protein